MEDRGGGGGGRVHRHIKKEEEKEITISLIMFERRLRPGQLNLCNELEAKSIKFLLLTTRYVNCLNYLCCFSWSHIDEQFSNFATEV